MSNIIITGNEPVRVKEPEVQQTIIPQTESDKSLEDRCLACLWEHYPGARWRVEVNSKTGMVNVFCLNLSSRWGHVYKISRIYGDPDLYWIKMAGGELLERARIARGRFDEDMAEIGCVEGIRPQDQPIGGVSI